jgi:prepilin-type N-terminal cleavage/methylation domain-containing protein
MTKRGQGFTLLELMVVVGIIGILSTVTVPSFKKYRSKARASEAKLSLSSMFVAEVDAYSQYTTYVSCLNFLGFTPAAASTRYYTIGFGTTGVGQAQANPNWGNSYLTNILNLDCDIADTGSTDGIHNFGAGKFVSGNTRVTDYQWLDWTPLTTSMTQSTFTVAASGFISIGDKNDTWTIDHTKKIVHPLIGY